MKRGLLFFVLFAVGSLLSWRVMATMSPVMEDSPVSATRPVANPEMFGVAEVVTVPSLPDSNVEEMIVAQRDKREREESRDGDRDRPEREREGERERERDGDRDRRDRPRGERESDRDRRATRDHDEHDHGHAEHDDDDHDDAHRVLRQLEVQHEELKRQFGPNHPHAVALKQRIQMARRQLDSQEDHEHDDHNDHDGRRDDHNHDHGHGGDRTEHLMAAAEHLHAAGMHELGELVEQHAHASRREPRELLERIERLEIHVERLTDALHRLHPDAHGDHDDHQHGDHEDHDHADHDHGDHDHADGEHDHDEHGHGDHKDDDHAHDHHDPAQHKELKEEPVIEF